MTGDYDKTIAAAVLESIVSNAVVGDARTVRGRTDDLDPAITLEVVNSVTGEQPRTAAAV
jgi:hypothetical protein